MSDSRRHHSEWPTERFVVPLTHPSAAPRATIPALWLFPPHGLLSSSSCGSLQAQGICSCRSFFWSSLKSYSAILEIAAQAWLPGSLSRVPDLQGPLKEAPTLQVPLPTFSYCDQLTFVGKITELASIFPTGLCALGAEAASAVCSLGAWGC